MNLLSSICVVMVGTTLPANIGSAARAMHTMGLSKLRLVAPKLPIDDTSHANAAGGTSVLDNAIYYQDLPNAIGDCSLILAASARSRHLPRPLITPEESAMMAYDFLQKNPNAKIALLFGREDRGLTNDELALAHYHIQIPANPNYPVLNVASAIQVIASNIFAHFHKHSHQPTTDKHTLTITHRQDWDEPPITHAEQLSLEQDIIALMQSLRLAHQDDLKDLPKRLSRLTSRLQLDKKEYTLLKSIIHKLHHHPKQKH